MRVGGFGLQCVDFLFEFRAERCALDFLWRARIIGASNCLCSLQDIPCPIRSHQQDEYEAHASTLQKDGRRHTWDQAICDCCSRLSLHVSQTSGAEVVKGPCRYWFWIICVTISCTTDTRGRKSCVSRRSGAAEYDASIWSSLLRRVPLCDLSRSS